MKLSRMGQLRTSIIQFIEDGGANGHMHVIALEALSSLRRKQRSLDSILRSARIPLDALEGEIAKQINL